jgi:hypothetical protein
MHQSRVEVALAIFKGSVILAPRFFAQRARGVRKNKYKKAEFLHLCHERVSSGKIIRARAFSVFRALAF